MKDFFSIKVSDCRSMISTDDELKKLVLYVAKTSYADTSKNKTYKSACSAVLLVIFDFDLLSKMRESFKEAVKKELINKSFRDGNYYQTGEKFWNKKESGKNINFIFGDLPQNKGNGSKAYLTGKGTSSHMRDYITNTIKSMTVSQVFSDLINRTNSSPYLEQKEKNAINLKIEYAKSIFRSYVREEDQDEEYVRSLYNEPLDEESGRFIYKKGKRPKGIKLCSNSSSYVRDKQTAINALKHANFSCEIEQSHECFERKNSSKPYTEPHHLVPMSANDDFPDDVSLDVEQNIVSLCCNCHKKIHYGNGYEEMVKLLYSKRQNYLKDVGIEIDLNELLQYYS